MRLPRRWLLLVVVTALTSGTAWILPAFGWKNTFIHAFTVSQPQTIRVGAAMRGRLAIRNNGWFMDDWRLYQVGN